MANTQPGEELLLEGRDRVAPLPEGREVEADDVEPVIQVGPEPAFGDFLIERPIARGDQPGLERLGPGGADRLEGPLLDHAEDLGLDGHRQRVDPI